MPDYFEQEQEARYAELLESLRAAAAEAEEHIASMLFNCTLEARDGATLYLQIRGRPPHHITTPLRPRFADNPFVKEPFRYEPLPTREYELWSFSVTKATALYKEV